MPAGRPQKANAGTLYSFAHTFYWDFRRIAEGRTRFRFDRERFTQLEAGIIRFNFPITDEQKQHIASVVDREIRDGRLSATERANWIRNAEESQIVVDREWMLGRAADHCRIEVRVPGEPDVITDLLAAKTVEQVREICADAFATGERQFEPGITRVVRLPNWPIPVGSVLPSNISQYASEFLAAKKDPRFPKSNTRPSTRLKQLWFISRALAGALFGVRTRTAINLVGSKRPDTIFEESRSGKSRRIKRKNTITKGR
jgi:hypothetical protein